MKKTAFLVLFLILSISLQGCTGIFGGMHQRELGEYTDVFSNEKSNFLKYNISTEEGFIKIDNSSIELCNEAFDGSALSQADTTSKVVISEFNVDTFPNYDDDDEYGYLHDQIDEVFDNPKNYELIVLEKNNRLYGAINCYKRPSGRSGNLLSNEDLDKAYLFNVENKKIKITNTLDKTAVLAFNETHYVAYLDKQFYSADKNGNKKIKICDDIWWDNGPTFYSYVNVYFVDDIFMICGNRGTVSDEFITLIVGNISGERIKKLINDKKVY